MKNAIIMAAGTSSRFLPISYEIPKGLIFVKGEVLIERQIKQLKEAKIEDITIVVGYKKEQFYYLREKYQVSIVENEEYKKYNNISSLMKVWDKIDATYICSSDNYFTKNVFLEEEEEAYYSVEYREGKTEEYCVSFDEEDRIHAVTVGGRDSYIMLGHVYFSSPFSKIFKGILEREYKKEETRKQLWEQVYMRYIPKLSMKIKRYEKGIMYEFDSLEDIRNFEPTFQSNSKILKEIQVYFGCEEKELSNFVSYQRTRKEFSFYFSYCENRYMYCLNRAENTYSIEICKGDF